MTTFFIEDMTCGHCASTITKAVKGADLQASITIDLPQHRVDITASTDTASLEAAIRNAGYTPILQA